MNQEKENAGKSTKLFASTKLGKEKKKGNIIKKTVNDDEDNSFSEKTIKLKEKNKLNNLNNPNQYNFYQNMYMSPMQINNQNPAYYNEYQNYYYLNPSQPYQMNRQMFPAFIPNSFIMPPRNLEESLNMIYSRNIVNHIIGAFFIKECQERQKNSEKRKVPVAKVELNDNNEDNNNKETEEKNNSEKKENDLDIPYCIFHNFFFPFL